jgi:hypothetical protein
MPYWRTLNHYALSWQCERGCSEEQLVRIPFQVNFQALFATPSSDIKLHSCSVLNLKIFRAARTIILRIIIDVSFMHSDILMPKLCFGVLMRNRYCFKYS